MKNTNNFINSSYSRKIEKPWGYEIHFVPDGKPYMGKILHIKTGKRLSLQIHEKKQESWFIIKGQAKVVWDNAYGKLIETDLEFGRGYTCEIRQRHRLVAITDCDIVEVSTPEIGTTYRLEDDYNRKNETEEIRKQERKNI